ncbi:MAG: uracil-DNA glycosylase family protein [Methylobacter sp.]|nr:uracil-DNA glycosylase family protein [Methylobacter sp.]
MLSAIIEKLRQGSNKSGKPYLVKDLADDRKILLILESPHKDEIEHEAPLAGRSGKSVTKVLKDVLSIAEADRESAFGRLVKAGKVKKIGLMNISNLPLQMAAYEYEDFCPELRNVLGIFEAIRSNPKKRAAKPANEDINKLIDSLSDDFNRRIARIDENVIIILCGNFVQTFWKHYVKKQFSTIIEVPHPSYGNWEKSRYSRQIKGIIDRIK